jgi:hypothetical protein
MSCLAYFHAGNESIDFPRIFRVTSVVQIVGQSILKKESDDFPSLRITLPPLPPALFNVIFQGSGGSNGDGVTVLMIGTLIKRDVKEKLKAAGESTDPLNCKKSWPSIIFESESDVNFNAPSDPSFENPKGMILFVPDG